MNDLRRVLVTGSRTWTDTQVIADALLDCWHGATEDGADGILVVHGACPRGADALAAKWAADNNIPAEPHPADWNTNGKGAGFIRNQHMVNLGARICLAFIHNSSRGATHTADLAEKADIPVRRYTA